MQRKKLFLFTVLFCLCLLGQTASAATVKDITHTELNSVLQAEKNIIIIDLRTEAEFLAGHLDDAVNIDFRGPEFSEKIKELAQKHPDTNAWVVYCKSGNRSRQALPLLEKELPGTIYHLEKGFINQ